MMILAVHHFARIMITAFMLGNTLISHSSPPPPRPHTMNGTRFCNCRKCRCATHSWVASMGSTWPGWLLRAQDHSLLANSPPRAQGKNNRLPNSYLSFLRPSILSSCGTCLNCFNCSACPGCTVIPNRSMASAAEPKYDTVIIHSR